MNIETAKKHLTINQIKNSAQDPVKIKKQYINLEKDKKMKTTLTKEYLQEVSNKIHNNTYLITGEYVNNITPIEMIHLLCGFDFYIEKLNMCIEYDGEQHFMPIKWFGGDEGLENIKIRAGIKNKFCQDNNIKLLRISYKEDVELKLKDIFNI